MLLQEPFCVVINKSKPYALFKIKDNEFLLFNGIQTMELEDTYKNNYIILTGEDVIPFILVHNMRINASLELLKNSKFKIRNKNMFNVLNNACIENELNTTLTVHDIYKEYDDGIVTYDELHIYLAIDAQRKYNTTP